MRVADGKKSNDRDGREPVMELPGGQKLLSRRVTKVEQQRLPLLAIETPESISKRRRPVNLKRSGGGLHDGLGNLEPKRQLSQEQNLRTCVRHLVF